MSFSTRVLRSVPLAASLALVACGGENGGTGDPISGGPESCLTKAPECSAFASCVYDEADLPVCRCDPGYEGDGTTCVAIVVPVAPCDTNDDCSDNASCVYATFCACDSGYRDDSTGEGYVPGTNCVDVDECASADTNGCDEHAACENLAGSYACVCTPGYVDAAGAEEPGRTCVLVDACLAAGPDACGPNSHCVNTADAYECVCNAWFTEASGACVPAAPQGAGMAHGCTLDPADESIRCWGRGPAALDLGTPTRMGDETGFVGLSQDGTCGFRRDGSLWCWWYGVSRTDGQLLVDWRQVGGAGGWLKTVGAWGTRADGTIWSWDPAATPIVPTQYGTDTDWTDVCPGFAATCGTKRDGTAWCWADGVPERVQVGEATDYLSLSCAGGLTCGLRGDGRADCWWPRTVPAETEGGDPTLVAVPFALRAGLDHPTATVIEDVAGVSVGGTFVCAVREAGGVWCAGTFGDPSLRAGDPLVVDSEPWLGPIDTAADWRSVAAGLSHACGTRHDAITGAETAYCWGANDAGQLGGAGAGTTTPVPVAF